MPNRIKKYLSEFPELAKEWDYEANFPVTPDKVSSANAKKYYWICPIHGSYLQSPNKRTLQHAGCPECAKGKQSSFAEQAFYYYVKQIWPDAINRYSGGNTNQYELDIFVPSINLGIEYDGIAFHKKQNKLNIEKEKYNACVSNGIKLIRIKDYSIKELLGEKIADDVYETEYDGKTYKPLEDTIKFVLSKINYTRKCIDINLERDRFDIEKLRIYDLKEKSLASKYPEIAKYWHPTKNGKIKPEYEYANSNHKYWWVCENGHDYYMSIQQRVNSKWGCPVCFEEQHGSYSNKRIIYQYDLNGNFIKKWNCIKSASDELKINDSNITMAAKGMRTNAGGYRWSYTQLDNLPPLIKNKTRKPRSDRKTVKQYSLNNEFIKEFPSILQASKETGIDTGSICRCIKGVLKQTHGFKWKCKNKQI